MILEALSPTCWSPVYVLKLNGRPLGKYQGRWFSENVDVYLTGRGQLCLEKQGWLGSHFMLSDGKGGRVLARAERAGVLTSAWELWLSTGRARLVSAGWLNTGYEVVQQGRILAEVDCPGWCNSGWAVADHGALQRNDLLFVGLIYHTILRRNAASDS